MQRLTTYNYFWFHNLFGLFTAMIGYTRHGSLLWAIFDGIFNEIVWIKWLILHEVNISLIVKSFTWFLK